MKKLTTILSFVAMSSVVAFNIYAANEEAAVVTETEVVKTTTPDLGDLAGGIERYRIDCNLGKDERQIKVIAQNDESVGVTYEKFDDVKTVALAKEVPAYADQVAERIKDNLENSGFSCQSSKTDVGAKDHKS